MKHVASKVIAIVIPLLVVLNFVVLGVLACTEELRFGYEDRESGDFVVRFYKDKDYCEIIGTTEQGNNQRFLIIPEYIEGVKVRALGCKSLLSGFNPSNLTAPDIASDVIEKAYFVIDIPVSGNSFINCTKCQKVMYPTVNSDSDRLSGSGRGTNVYYPRKSFESVYGTNYTQGYRRFPANVSYYYNYEGSANDGYYWIDDCEYGSVIEYIPPEPKREGYEFGGWYKEAECINAWNFDTDTLPEEKKELEAYGDGFREVTAYQETILYAKWV